MFKFTPSHSHGTPHTLLCIGAHSDDIEIGCGGAILRLTQNYPNLKVNWVILSAGEERAAEAEASAADFLRHAGSSRIRIQHFRDGYFPYIGGQIKDYFEQLKSEVEPDLIFTHCRHDLHQDHRITAELTWNTFRNHVILEYEIPKYEGDLQTPNFFIHLDEKLCRQKVSYLMQHFATQTNRYWFTPETFRGLMKMRGVESRAPGGYAEGFHCRKVVI
jgi:LmbE family N-acetylglucosaminyl deacetylase